MIEACRQRVSAGINVDDSVAAPLPLANGIRLVPLGDPDYPPLLAQCGMHHRSVRAGECKRLKDRM